MGPRDDDDDGDPFRPPPALQSPDQTCLKSAGHVDGAIRTRARRAGGGPLGSDAPPLKYATIATIGLAFGWRVCFGWFKWWLAPIFAGAAVWAAMLPAAV